MIVFENYKKDKVKNKYGRFFLADEATADDNGYIPPRPRNVKIITTKPNNRRVLDFSAGAEDLMNDPNLDNMQFDLGAGVDPTDDLPNIDDIFNNPVINDQLNISNDNPEEIQPTEEPPVNVNQPANVPQPEEVPPVENPVDTFTEPVENQPVETPPEENVDNPEEVPADVQPPVEEPATPDENINQDVPAEGDTGGAIDVPQPEDEPIVDPATEEPPINNPNPEEVPPAEGEVPDPNTNPGEGEVITPDGDDMGAGDDFSAGGEMNDLGTEDPNANPTGDQQNPQGVGVGLDTMRKYTLFNEFIHFGNAISNYISKLENIVLDDPGQNQVIKYVIDTLHNIKDMIYDFISMKFELSSYFSARTFFDEMYVSTQLAIGMLSKLKDYRTEEDDKTDTKRKEKSKK